MRTRDAFRYSFQAIHAHGLRSLLTTLGIAIGIGAVVLLTAIGEGIHRFVLSEFTQFGTHLISVTPGRTTTLGLSGAAIISTVHPLSTADAQALARLPQVKGVSPLVQGNAAIEFGKRQRRALVLGVGADLPQVWQMEVALGQFLPDDSGGNRALAVLGAKLRKELFGKDFPLGKRIRVAGESYRVSGVFAPKGQMLGFDLDDAVYIPVERALALFNRQGVMEIDLLQDPEADGEALAHQMEKLLEQRHGRRDFTVTTQDQMLSVAASILDALTITVAALGGISLFVGAIGIFAIMTIAVGERRQEIGLLRALGASRYQILWLFLSEAAILGLLGGFAGFMLGMGSIWIIGLLVPLLPTQVAWSFALAAEGVSLGIGLAAGIGPAVQAARLDPILALRDE